MALEGDIKGAYDNENFKVLLEILRHAPANPFGPPKIACNFRGTKVRFARRAVKKITDERFISIIEDSLKCGLMFKDHYHDTLLGVPQGSIVSPLFFNIYMFEFDKYVQNELTNQFVTPKKNRKRKKYK